MNNLKKVNIFCGRFQPFHKGHLKCCEDAFKKNGYPVFIFYTPNKQFDNRKPFDDKLLEEEYDILVKNYDYIEGYDWMQFPQPVRMCRVLKEKGYEGYLWIAGEDRIDNYKKLLNQSSINKIQTELEVNVPEIYLSNRYGSATEVREAIKTNNKKRYMELMPKGTENLFNKFKEQIDNINESSKKLINFIHNNFNNMSLKNYILESNQTDLINRIKAALNNLDEEKLYKILNIIEPINKDKLTEKFKKLGLDSSKDGILKIIEDKFNQKEREFILNNIILTNTDDNKNDYKFSADEFIKSNNIYDLINSKCKDDDNNPIFSLNALKELAIFDKRSGTQAGKFEFICQLFMKNINEQNKGKNDINTKDGIEFEFKGFKASIRSQETTHNPSIVYKKFKELLSDLLSDDTSKVQDKQSSLIRLYTDLDKQLDEIEYNSDFYTDVVTNLDKYDFLRAKKIFNTYFNKLLTYGISDDTLNTFLGISLIRQIQLPNGYDRDTETEKIIHFLKKNNSFEGQKANANIFWKNILVIHLYFYYGHHHWSYLTIFGVAKSSPIVYDGSYICLGKEIFDPKSNDVLNNLKNKLDEFKIFPTQGLYNDERQKAPTVSLYSKNINRKK